MSDDSTAEKAKSAEAYGLPTTYEKAVEEVHEWREAAHGGHCSPSGLRTLLIDTERHHSEHHKREDRVLAATAKAFAHRRKAAKDGASRIAYEFCAVNYLEEILSALPDVDEEGVCAGCEAQPTGEDGRSAFCVWHR